MYWTDIIIKWQSHDFIHKKTDKVYNLFTLTTTNYVLAKSQK